MAKKTTPAATVPQAHATGRTLKQNTNVLVFGKKGYGKSTWTEEIATKHHRRVVFVDPLGDYTGGTIYTDIREFKAAMTRLHTEGDFRAIVRCPGHETEVFDLFAWRPALKRAPIANCLLVVEEITLHCDSDKIHPALMSHLQYGRHSLNSLLGVARSPYEINRHLTRQADLVVAFRQDEERDIKYFRDFAGEKADQLRTLERGQALLMRGTAEELQTFIAGGR